MKDVMQSTWKFIVDTLSSKCIWMLLVSWKLDRSFEKKSDEKKNIKIRDTVKKTVIFLALADEN